MHALIVKVTIDQNHMEEANKILESEVVPMVRQAPGLDHGYWLAPEGDKGLSIILFKDEQSAKAGAEMARNSPSPEFVKFDSIEVREVIAQT